MRFGYRKSATVTAVVVAMIAASDVVSYATPPVPDASATTLRTLQRLNPEALANAAHASPNTAGSGVTASGNGRQIKIGLPFAAQARSTHADANGLVAHDNGNGTTTVPIAQHDGSVQIDTIITKASAPRRFSYHVALPVGDSLTPDNDGGVDILNASGAWVAGFVPAWAKDANGNPVATHYEVRGDALTQVVDAPSTTAYPVMAASWLGLTIVDHVSWVMVSKWSPTLAVFPTRYGRYVAPNVAEGAAWGEVVSKGGGRANTSTMRVQFDCHWYAVRVYAPRKPSWDLDSKRPYTSLLNEINYKCNYPDGGEEW